MNTMYPEALIIEPMKINKIPDGKEHMFPSLCESGEYFAQLKKDGYWYMFERTANHSYLFSRNKSVETGALTEKGANVPHIMQALASLPAGTILIGEIYYPGKRSKDVTPIMGSLPEKAIERQNGEYGWGARHILGCKQLYLGMAFAAGAAVGRAYQAGSGGR